MDNMELIERLRALHPADLDTVIGALPGASVYVSANAPAKKVAELLAWSDTFRREADLVRALDRAEALAGGASGSGVFDGKPDRGRKGGHGMTRSSQATGRPHGGAVSEHVDVVILTVLVDEFNAVKAKLENVRPWPGVPEAPNLYAWHLAEITRTDGSGRYAVALGKVGQAGNSPSTAAALDMIARWSPRYVLFVGIAGGLRWASRGDVVLAQTIFGYEYGTVKGGSFKTRPDWTCQADPALLNGASVSGESWRGRIGVRPPSGCPTKVHVGGVASGDKVVEDPDAEFFRSVLDTYDLAIAIEMEGAGVGFAVQQAHAAGRALGYLMIRGISDVPRKAEDGETHGSEEREAWKAYASDVAAAFAVGYIAYGLPVPPREGGEAEADASGTEDDIEYDEAELHQRIAEVAREITTFIDLHIRLFLVLGQVLAGKPKDAAGIANALAQPPVTTGIGKLVRVLKDLPPTVLGEERSGFATACHLILRQLLRIVFHPSYLKIIDGKKASGVELAVSIDTLALIEILVAGLFKRQDDLVFQTGTQELHGKKLVDPKRHLRLPETGGVLQEDVRTVKKQLWNQCFPTEAWDSVSEVERDRRLKGELESARTQDDPWYIVPSNGDRAPWDKIASAIPELLVIRAGKKVPGTKDLLVTEYTLVANLRDLLGVLKSEGVTHGL